MGVRILEIWRFPIKFLAKKFVFLILSGWNEILPLLAPPAKIFLATSGKFILSPSLEKILPMPMYSIWSLHLVGMPTTTSLPQKLCFINAAAVITTLTCYTNFLLIAAILLFLSRPRWYGRCIKICYYANRDWNQSTMVSAYTPLKVHS